MDTYTVDLESMGKRIRELRMKCYTNVVTGVANKI